MLKTVLAVALLCLFSFNAEARTKLHPMCGIQFGCDTPSASSPDQVRYTRGKYVARQMGFGSPVEPKRHVRAKVGKSETYRRAAPVQHVAAVAGYSISKPARYIAGRLICAINVGVALAERGIKGTGSALALSYLRWGHSAGGPVPGAVIVSARRGGGHVAIVSRVENGVVYAWNATGGQRDWREIPYRHHVIDYRVPG